MTFEIRSGDTSTWYLPQMRLNITGRLDGFNNRIIALHARGLGWDVSADGGAGAGVEVSAERGEVRLR